MFQKWLIAAILVLSLLPTLATHVTASTVSIAVFQDSITVNMNILFQENLTALPPVDATVSLTNASNIVQTLLDPIKNAIQVTVPSARISNFSIHARSFNASGMWTLQENYSLVLTGTNANSGSNIRSNLGFIPMNLNQSLQLANLELNTVGPTFLLPALEAKAAAYSNLLYFIDGAQTRNAVIPEQTTKTFWLFDFSWIPPVSTWSIKNDILGQSTAWTFSPASPRYNLTLGLPSPEGPLLASYTAIYNPSMTITVPANAWVSGNTVYYDVPAPSEIAMPLIVTISLILALATIVVDRRLIAPSRAQKRARPKSR